MPKYYRKVYIVLIMTLLLATAPLPIFAGTVDVIGTDPVPAAGAGTASDAYNYLISDDSKVTWKHLNDLKEQNATDCYVCRQGDRADGRLRYSLTFTGAHITVPEGPYFLGIHFYPGKELDALPGEGEGYYFSFANKRDFPGKVSVRMDVAEQYADTQSLYLYYYGGYDSAVVHGAAPAYSKDEISRSDGKLTQVASGIKPQKGYAEFEVRHGGNYFLTDQLPADRIQADQEEFLYYEDGHIWGTIDTVFSTKAIAGAVANYLGRGAQATLTQGDVSGIKKLYLSNMGIGDIKELTKMRFDKLESLDISKNGLETLAPLTMPMLNYLDASENKLNNINGVLGMSALENLNLKGNSLSNIPDFSNLINLRTLDLSGNAITVVPALKNPKLLYLNLNGNKLTKLPDLSACTNLKTVDIQNQKYETAARLEPGQPYQLKPVPEIITQYGKGIGLVSLTDQSGKVIQSLSFAELKEQEYTIDSSQIGKAGEYMLTITGYNGIQTLEERDGAAVLGVYTYRLKVGNGSGYKGRLATALLILLVCGVGGWLFVRKSAKKSIE